MTISDRKDCTPLMENGTLKEFILKINGKSFNCNCNCGCNVFHKPDKNNLSLYKCNCCNREYCFQEN